MSIVSIAPPGKQAQQPCKDPDTGLNFDKLLAAAQPVLPKVGCAKTFRLRHFKFRVWVEGCVFRVLGSGVGFRFRLI